MSDLIESLDLDLLPPNATYNLYKTGEKRASPYGYPSTFVVIKDAKLQVHSFYDLKEGAVVVPLLNSPRYDSFFKTSPIIKFDIETLEFETFNSYYRLECLSID